MFNILASITGLGGAGLAVVQFSQFSRRGVNRWHNHLHTQVSHLPNTTKTPHTVQIPCKSTFFNLNWP